MATRRHNEFGHGLVAFISREFEPPKVSRRDPGPNHFRGDFGSVFAFGSADLLSSHWKSFKLLAWFLSTQIYSDERFFKLGVDTKSGLWEFTRMFRVRLNEPNRKKPQISGHVFARLVLLPSCNAISHRLQGLGRYFESERAK